MKLKRYIHVLLYTSVFILIVVFGATIRKVKFKRLLTFDNKQPRSSIDKLGTFSQILHLGQCVRKCLESADCTSFFYNSEQKTCILTQRIASFQLTNGGGYVFYSADDFTEVQECYTTEAGRNYAGRINITVVGTSCQRWDSQTPHTHDFKYMSDQENYCRGVGVGADSPWCYTINPSQRWQRCYVKPCAKVQSTGDCYKFSRGEDYYGTINVTADGVPCQRWDSDSPHGHYFHDLDGEENYCRKPPGLATKPWCFTVSPSIRYGFCNISQCAT